MEPVVFRSRQGYLRSVKDLCQNVPILKHDISELGLYEWISYSTQD